MPTKASTELREGLSGSDLVEPAAGFPLLAMAIKLTNHMADMRASLRRDGHRSQDRLDGLNGVVPRV